MAAIQFPANPNAGDLFTAGNGIRYTYDGEKWKTLGTSTVGTEGQFLETPTVLTIDKLIPANTNTGAVGPMAINTGVTLTIPSTSTFRTLSGRSGAGSGGDTSPKMPIGGGTFTGPVNFANNTIIKGNAIDGSGKLTLNCENNSHGINIKGPPHSAGANYTLTLPNDTGTNGQVLTTNGSGVSSWSTLDLSSKLSLTGGTLTGGLTGTTANFSSNVGVGTSSPAQKLHVKSSATAGGIVSLFDDSGSGATGRLQLMTTGGSGSDNFRIASVNRSLSLGSATTDHLTIKGSTGNVGIGISNAAARLTVKGSSSSLTGQFLQGGDTVAERVIIAQASSGNNFGAYVDSSNVRHLVTGQSDALTTDGNFVALHTSSGSERLRIDNSGRLLVGMSSAIGSDGLQNGGSGNAGNGAFYRFDANDSGPFLELNKSRNGTVGSNTLVQSGDELGTINFKGADGTNYKSAARIAAFVDSTPGSNDMPGRLVFSTTADGASSPTERLRIDSSGTATFTGNITSGGNQTGEIQLGNGSGAGGQKCNMTFTGSGNEFFDIGIKGSQSQYGHIRFNTGTTPTERLRIDSSGRLLVGTTTEGEGNADDLTIASTGNTGITVRSGTSSSGNIFFSDGTSGNDEIRGYIQYLHASNSLLFGANAQERLRILSDGTITTGGLTSTPATVAPGSFIQGTSGGFFSNGYDGKFGTSSNHPISFQINGIEKVRIDSSGRLLVGSSTVQAHPNTDDLQLGNGTGNRGLTISSGTSAYGSIAFGDSADGSGTDRYPGLLEYYHGDNSMRLYTNVGERVRIDSSGNVGIGTSSPSSKLQVNGTVTATAFSGNGAALTNLPAIENSFASSAPSSPGTGDFWVDTTNTPPELKSYNGTAWVAVGSSSPTTSPPSINNVVLSEASTSGARFTSKTFNSAITMVDNGTPVSQKGIKGKVTAEFAQYPSTSATTSNTTGGQGSTTTPTYSTFDVHNGPYGTGYAKNIGGAGVYYDAASNGLRLFYLSQRYSSSSYVDIFTQPLSNLGGTSISDWSLGNGSVSNVSRYSNTRSTIACFEPIGPDGVYRLITSEDDKNGSQWINIAEAASGGYNAQRDVDDIQYHNGKYYEARNGYIREYNNYSDMKQSTGVTNSYTYSHGNGSSKSMRFRIEGNEIMVVLNSSNYYAWSGKFSWPPTGNMHIGGGEVYPNRYGRGFGNLVYASGKWITSINSSIYQYVGPGQSWTQVSGGKALQFFDGALWAFKQDGSIAKWMKSYNGGSTWTAAWTNSQSGSSQTTIVDSSGYQSNVFDAAGYRFFYGANSYNFQLRLFGYQKLSQVVYFNTAMPAQFVEGDAIKVDGDTDTANIGIIHIINSDRKSMSIKMSREVVAGDILIATNQTGTAVSSLFLVIDATGGISNMQSSDPGFVTLGPGTSQSITFPAFFPTGNAPDTELPSGTTIQVEVEATNSSASDTYPSNIVTPS